MRMDDKVYKNVLIMSDQHEPYGHPDALPFYTAVKKEFGPFDKVISVGDEIDNHAISFHESNPDLYSATDELEAAIEKLKPFYKLFPKVDLVDSNHGSLVYRRICASGLPSKVMKTYREIIEAPETWTWQKDLKIKIPGNTLYIHHGKSPTPLKLAQSVGMCTAEGHYHGKYSITYWGTPERLLWGMQVGCMIDDHSLAFAYNKTTLARPIIGCGIVVNGQPMLIPLIMNKDGRWIGSIL